MKKTGALLFFLISAYIFFVAISLQYYNFSLRSMMNHQNEIFMGFFFLPLILLLFVLALWSLQSSFRHRTQEGKKKLSIFKLTVSVILFLSIAGTLYYGLHHYRIF